MTALDYVVLAAYLTGTLSVGLYFARRNKTTTDMFTAGGGSPWWVTGLSSFMTMFSAGTFVIWGSIAYTHGIVAVAINMTYGIAALAAGFLVAGKWNALGVRTPAEYVELRFGRSALQLYTWTLIVFRIVTTAVALYALAVIVAAIMPLAESSPFRDATTGNISIVALIIVFGLVAVFYTLVGGLWAVLMTDVLQFIILNLSVLFIIVLTFLKIDDFGGLLASAPDGFFDLVSGGYTYFFLVGWCLSQFFMIGAEWAFVQRSLSVSSPVDARKANYLFGALYLVSPVLWLAPPLMFRLTHPGVDPEQAYILAGQWVLPAGAVGLMVAAMFSATASMISSQLNVFASVLTNDVYREFFNPSAKERTLVVAGRTFTGLLGLILVVLAIAVPQLGGAERVIISLSSLVAGPLMAPSIWGLLGRRIDGRAVWATALICLGLGVVVKFGLGYLNAVTGFLWLDDVHSWVSNNPQTADMLLGVVLPIIILSTAHSVSAGVAPGWERIGSCAESVLPTRQKSLKPIDTTPALVVAIALLICGSTLLLLIPFNQSAALPLGILGAIVIGIGFTTHFFIRRSAGEFHSRLSGQRNL
ncbi:Na+:solute symporter [Exilibacterium tricleocarpae]|uniref:Na+:solute symporter n=1 Tax=Exilibacterium tricleocarpae TaxID=2591008 RepID=A0A545T003_9GAMM|nr:Na+:solute symporter [Exilibacterium tricleocarpae]TQV70554.1 Na+:solute symporter [Exilibacterium tricleocarpae]